MMFQDDAVHGLVDGIMPRPSVGTSEQVLTAVLRDKLLQ